MLPAPKYTGHDSPLRGAVLGVATMKDHTTDEGHQLEMGLVANGYTHCGHSLTVNETDVTKILERVDPTVVMLQDKREWDVEELCFRDHEARFHNVQSLRERDDIFKVTVLKDSHQRPQYHMRSAEEIGCHAWVTYYSPNIVHKLAAYTRPQHLIRVYHSLNPDIVPEFSDRRSGALLSGAVSGAYPLRAHLAQYHNQLPETVYLKHPGYHRKGCATPEFLKTLNQFKIAICTASIYDYHLRKMIEATACGCMVVTNLSKDDPFPGIDGNMYRVPSNCSVYQMKTLLEELYHVYDPEKQKHFAKIAIEMYDYKVQGLSLLNKIEDLRKNYNRN